jgi:hypothetical protein
MTETTETPESDPQAEFSRLLAELSLEFDARTVERHKRGEEKYGNFKWLGTDLIEELCQELLDTANYARYHFIKLRMLQMHLEQDERIQSLADEGGNFSIGIQNFFSAGDAFGTRPPSRQGTFDESS